ncbi:hypothetical protein CTI12_AA333020 [Artemisia annua]|uniref:DUF4283 domain-containing protein n=1 Tax=Artemisia annua TaxID=35608 RepID=A0A2U1MX65_ARTAN|nr:hypothetical protein CTI12_AA333020 [Artemisia annua]
MCDPIGIVADVYIARKLSKLGKRFAFVRFLKVKDIDEIVKKLCGIWLGNYHLYASVARFDKKSSLKTLMNAKWPSLDHYGIKHPINAQPVNSGPRFYNVKKKGSNETQVNGPRSYAATLKGKLDPNKENTMAAACLKKVTLHESDLLNIADSRCVALVKVRDIHLILNINKMLRREGFSDYTCKYMGGLWLWVEFQTKDACLKFKEHAEMEWYFTQIHSISDSFMVDERIIWLEIEGLPLCAWTTMAFKKVANAWGEPIFVDDDPTENMSIGRVCVKTKLKSTISEVCSVTIKNVSCTVRVKEFSSWVPSLESVDDSIKDIESEDSDNDEIKSSIPDMEHQEEGEIHEEVNEPIESQPQKDSNSPNEEEKDKEANTKNNETEPTWVDEVFKMQKEEEQQNIVSENQSNSLYNDSHENGDIAATSSPSKPPGFGGIRFQSSNLSQGNSKEGCHSSAHSNRNATRSRSGKSHKSFRTTGSLIDAFISHIEMGSVLGYDMEGSKADLKKYIDSIGVNDGFK